MIFHSNSGSYPRQNVCAFIFLGMLSAGAFLYTGKGFAQTTVNFTTAAPLSVPSRSNFSGANMELFGTGTSYLDTSMQKLANSMNLGWTRFPGGTADDYYAWEAGSNKQDGTSWPAGSTPYDWASQFASFGTFNYSIVQKAETIVGGKLGGISLTDYSTFVSTQRTGPTGVLGSSPTQTIGVINIFTDTGTTKSAGDLVTAAAAAGIPVALWELGNEPVYYPTFISTSSNVTQQAMDYLAYVKPYAAAIKTANPSAKVAVWVDNKSDAWTKGIASYAQANGVFWDELYTHSYPGAPESDGPSQVEYYNGFLSTNTNALVDGELADLFGSNMRPIEWSEFNINPLADTIYNGVFISEFTMRLSSDSYVTYVGMHAAVSDAAGLEVAISEQYDYANVAPPGATTVIAACAWSKTLNKCTGTPIDTSGLNFNYFMTPSALAMQLINEPINTSEGLWPTSITGLPTVPISSGSLLAIYAQAYQYAGKTKYVLLTNKDDVPVTVTIQENGTTLGGTLTTKAIGVTCNLSQNPQTCQGFTNTYNSTPITIVKGSSTNGMVTVPAYGVMSVSWVE
jgi:hypothetical protein